MTRKQRGLEYFIVHDILPIYEVHAVLPRNRHFTEWPRDVNLGGVSVRTSRALRLFLFKGITCTQCGLKGAYYKIQRNGNSKFWHLALFGLRNGREVRFTIDHIVPRSHGGSRKSLMNQQTMCFKCNHRKGDTRAYGTKDQFSGYLTEADIHLTALEKHSG